MSIWGFTSARWPSWLLLFNIRFFTGTKFFSKFAVINRVVIFLSFLWCRFVDLMCFSSLSGIKSESFVSKIWVSSLVWINSLSSNKTSLDTWIFPLTGSYFLYTLFIMLYPTNIDYFVFESHFFRFSLGTCMYTLHPNTLKFDTSGFFPWKHSYGVILSTATVGLRFLVMTAV